MATSGSPTMTTPPTSCSPKARVSTSGRSANVNAAVVEARARGLRSIGLVGKGGGDLASLVDVAVVVPSDSTARIQECHITVAHALCELVDAVLFPETDEA